MSEELTKATTSQNESHSETFSHSLQQHKREAQTRESTDTPVPFPPWDKVQEDQGFRCKCWGRLTDEDPQKETSVRFLDPEPGRQGEGRGEGLGVEKC